MNEDLKEDKNDGMPGAKALVLAVVPFYVVGILNFFEFLARWFIFFWLLFVILEDYTDNIDKDRVSIVEMMLPGNKPRGFDVVMKERLTQWDRIKKVFYHQLKL